MIVHHVPQGSAAWLELRAGIPTASQFHRVLTPTGKPSTQATDYLHGLLAERLMGHPIVEHVSLWMQRGADLEAEANTFYEFQRETTTERIGFITNDAGTIGASPDRLVGEDGLLEIKVPKDSTHVGYLLAEPVSEAYFPQIQGQLWIAERQWLDLLSYHPEMPPALIRVERDEAYIAKLRAAIETFADVLAQHTEVLRARGWLPAEPVVRGGASITPAAAASGGGVGMDGSAPPPVKGAPVLTTEQKVSWARDALRLPDEQFDKIALHKLKGPLADAPDEEIESKLVPFLRACIKKNQVALDELANIIAGVPA